MHPPLLENLLWGFGTALKLLLLFLAVYRRLYRRLPSVMAYLVLLPAEAVAVWWAYREWGFDSRPAWYVYWTATGIVLFARGIAIAELCSAVLSRYSGIWAMMRKVLLFAASVLLLWAILGAAKNAYWMAAFVLAAQQGFEIAAAVILLMLLAMSVRYGVWLGGVERSFVLGFGFYSTLEAMNRTFLGQRLLSLFAGWDSARIACFDAVMVFWAVALLRELPLARLAPPLLSETVAAQQLRQSLGELRNTAQELKRVGKAVRK